MAYQSIAYVERLRRRQLDEGWSDERMARELGVSKTCWFLIRAGRRTPGVRFLRTATRRFPEYDVDVLLYLRSDVSLAIAREYDVALS